MTELYKGGDWLTLKPEKGIELSFLASSRCLETLYITLIQTVEDQSVYHGGLPQPFVLEMDQASVRATLGSPRESKGPMKLPNLPAMGGYDAYTLDPAVYSNTQVMTLIFTLIDTGHDCNGPLIPDTNCWKPGSIGWSGRRRP